MANVFFSIPPLLQLHLTFICLVRVFSCLSRSDFCSSSFITLPRNKQVRQELEEIQDLGEDKLGSKGSDPDLAIGFKIHPFYYKLHSWHPENWEPEAEGSPKTENKMN